MNLRWFRKHQKGMLVVFGAVLMAVFGLGGVVSMIDPSKHRGDPDGEKVVVEWKGGEYTRNELQALLRLHFQTLQFLYTIDGIKAKEQGINFTRNVRMIEPIQTNVSPESTDIQLVSRLLLAEKAKELGIEIGDSEVDAYIQSLSLDPMTETDMRYTNDEVNKGDVSLLAIKRHLKTELLSQRMEQFLGLSLYPTPNPTEALFGFIKMNREIECQVVGFPVKDYLAKVTNSPTTDELKELFSEGETDYPDPLNAKPGFKKPRAVKVGYFVADFKTFLANEKAKVTDEELQAEYEKWVKDKNPKVIEKIEDEKPKAGDGELKLPGEKDENKKSDESKSNSDAPKPGEGKSEGKKANEKSDAPKPKSEDKKSEDKKKEQASNSIRSSEILTSLQEQDGKQENESSKKEDGKKQDSNTKDESKKQDSSEKKAESNSKSDGKQKAGKQETGKQETGKTGDSKKQEQPVEKTRIKKLAEVADDIKASLKSADAQTALKNALKSAEDELLVYLQEYEIWKRSDEDSGEEEPTPINFKALANKLGLEYRETKDFVTDASILESEIGKIESMRFVRGPNNQIRPNFQKLGSTIFQNYHDLRLFDAKKADDFRTQKQYLYWVNEKRDPAILEFDEAKPMIEKFWKYQEARKLAKAAAEKFAKIVETRKVPMESVDGEKTRKTGAFKWLQMDPNGQVVIGTPKDVEKPGEKFMETAFSLDELDTGVAPNNTNEYYYAIQLIKKVPTTDDLTQSRIFMNRLISFQRLPPGMTQITARNTRKSTLAWIDEFDKEMGVKWKQY